MDVATQTHLKSLREALEFQLQELRGDIDAATQTRLDQAAQSDSEVSDRKDLAEHRAAADIVDEAERLDLAESEQVLAALKRLNQGTYGDCLDCGEPIGLQRLQVLPAAARCASCQTQAERAKERAHERGAGAADARHRR